MAGLFNALNAARTSLEVNQKSLEVVGNNISNLNTEGYSRQYTQLETYPAVNFGDFFIGNGVKVSNVQRDHDVFLQAQMEDKYVDYGYANGRTNSLLELERIFNITDDNLASDVDKFFDSWQELSASPSDLVLRDTVIQRGEVLATTFNNTANGLLTISSNINDSIISEVNSLNSTISEIAELNDRIYTIEIRGQGANTARDERDVLVKSLAEKLGATTYLDNNGMVNVQLPGGLPLVQGNMPMSLEAETSGAAVSLRLHAGGVVRDLSSNTLGGEMAGLFHMRDEFIPSVTDDLDKLAWEISDAVNTQHLAGAGLDGVTVSNFFLDVSALPTTNAARNMSVIITDAADVAAGLVVATPSFGDNRNALAMSNLGEEYLVDGVDTFNSFYGKITSNIGIESNQNALSIDGSQDAVDQLENLRDGFVGVSLEEEMISLIQYQRGFESSAKFLTTVDEMMSTLLDIKR